MISRIAQRRSVAMCIGELSVLVVALLREIFILCNVYDCYQSLKSSRIFITHRFVWLIQVGEAKNVIKCFTEKINKPNTALCMSENRSTYPCILMLAMKQLTKVSFYNTKG